MSTDSSQNNKRIAKNTLFLYFRMLFLMCISLYTSRVILNALGVVDYGIYNVVGGVVTMFSMISGSLSASISRFLTYELGTGNKEKLQTIFSTSVNIQLAISILIVVVAETVGLWFVNERLVIPEDRTDAANWCFQFSILTFVLNLVSVPYNATIIAHEKMNAFAYISIFEGLAKLIIAWFIVVNPIDRLVFFAAMVFLLSVVIRFIYGYYCNRHFAECRYTFALDREVLKPMFGFAGWNFIGASASVLNQQGGNILINLFFGPAVNGARAVAQKVNATIMGFVINFMTALNPQITKSYAAGEKDYMFQLMHQGARLSFYMILLLSMPIILNTAYILQIWLKMVPEHTVLFIQLTFIAAMSESLSQPLITAMLATGKIRNYQIIVGGLQLVNLPIVYLLFYLGCWPETVVVVSILLSQVSLGVRLVMLRNMIGLRIREYLKKVYLNVIKVTACAAVLPVGVSLLFEQRNFPVFLCLTAVSFSSTILTELYIGCTKEERIFVISKISTIYKQKVRRK